MSQILPSRRPSVGACLDDLLGSRFLPRSGANRVWNAHELPGPLESCVRSLARNSEWRAYGDGEHIFFAIAHAHAQGGAPQPDAAEAIDVYFLDDNASVYSAGVWEYDFQHGWWLDAVLDVSYDCDRGWWLDRLTETNR